MKNRCEVNLANRFVRSKCTDCVSRHYSAATRPLKCRNSIVTYGKNVFIAQNICVFSNTHIFIFMFRITPQNCRKLFACKYIIWCEVVFRLAVYDFHSGRPADCFNIRSFGSYIVKAHCKITNRTPLHIPKSNYRLSSCYGFVLII